MLQDVRDAARLLWKTKAWTGTVVLSLALGIGATAALFSAVNGVRLKTLPVRNPDNLVRLRHSGHNSLVTNSSDYGFSGERDGQQIRATFSYPMFQRLVAENRTLDEMSASAPYGRVNVIVDGRAETATAFISSGNFYDALGVRPHIGRTLIADDDRPTARAVGVISHRYWRARFAGNPTVLDTIVRVNNVPVTIVGVLSPEFTGIQRTIGEPPDVAVPLALDLQLNPGQTSGVAMVRADAAGRLMQPTYWWLQIMGRLKRGVTFAQVETNFDTLFQRRAQAGFESYVASLPAEERAMAARRDGPDVPRLIADSGSRGVYDVNPNDRQVLVVLGGVVLLMSRICCFRVRRVVSRSSRCGLRSAPHAAGSSGSSSRKH
jgi:hypothetical protein